MHDDRARSASQGAWDFEGFGDEAREWLDLAYGADLGLGGRMGAVRHRRLESDGIAVDSLTIDAPITFDAEPMPALVVVDVLRGQIEYTRRGVTDSGVDGDTLLASGWGLPFHGSGDGYEVRNTSIDVTVLDAAIGDVDPDKTRHDLVFHSFTPRSAAAGARWRATINEVRGVVAATDGAPDATLARGAATRLLGHTLLHTFANNVVDGVGATDLGRDRRDATQVVVRRAQAVMEARVGEDLSVSEIAHECGVTPRTLQYAFQQHLGCSPLAYLRRVRLDLVHRSLRHGEVTSVGDAAVRMGFYNPGRFAAEYRQAFGENPRETLRRATG